MAEAAGRTIEAGRETDREIGTRIFGYWMYHYDKDHPAHCYWSLLDPDCDPVASDFSGGERKSEAEAWDDMPHYSTRIEAAWLIVEHTMTQGWAWFLDADPSAAGGHFTADISVAAFTETVSVRAETAPLAITRAALQAVGVERPDADTREAK